MCTWITSGYKGFSMHLLEAAASTEQKSPLYLNNCMYYVITITKLLLIQTAVMYMWQEQVGSSILLLLYYSVLCSVLKSRCSKEFVTRLPERLSPALPPGWCTAFIQRSSLLCSFHHLNTPGGQEGQVLLSRGPPARICLQPFFWYLVNAELFR